MSLSTLEVASPLPSGVANRLGWSQIGTTGFYSASITVPSLTAQSVVTATLQCDTTNLTDANACWLLSAFPTTDTLTFCVAGNPILANNFPIAWHVSQI